MTLSGCRTGGAAALTSGSAFESLTENSAFAKRDRRACRGYAGTRDIGMPVAGIARYRNPKAAEIFGTPEGCELFGKVRVNVRVCE